MCIFIHGCKMIFLEYFDVEILLNALSWMFILSACFVSFFSLYRFFKFGDKKPEPHLFLLLMGFAICRGSIDYLFEKGIMFQFWIIMFLIYSLAFYLELRKLSRLKNSMKKNS